mgnify:CR=1 FL=1
MKMNFKASSSNVFQDVVLYCMQTNGRSTKTYAVNNMPRLYQKGMQE